MRSNFFKMLLFFFVFILLIPLSWAEESKVIFEYKKYEKFDFDELGVEGEMGAPGDLSILSDLRREFQNKLPEKTNFLREMRKSANGIR
jgi:hypothetical protein